MWMKIKPKHGKSSKLYHKICINEGSHPQVKLRRTFCGRTVTPIDPIWNSMWTEEGTDHPPGPLMCFNCWFSFLSRKGKS